ncbi:MAG TPA: Gfo/Idh/MocA family oxidoreductase [Candidatus Anammoximicrobium sp.]|nr:Gfo/Idh/MocA family oxidoreductase [Candidatus Anammoximicrobium sp.]
MRKQILPAASGPSRRDFIKASSLLVAGRAVSGGLNVARAAHAYGSDEIRIGLIGCGGRGTGAAQQALNTVTKSGIAPSGPVRLVAMADVFPDKVQSAYRSIKSQQGDLVDVPPDRQFSGLDAYQRVLECELDLVILATPPGFRPLHFEAAVAAGKHVFVEKPVATDPPGVRRVLAANEEAKRRNLLVAVGLQRRHERKYQETIQRLWDGAIGDVVCLRVYWNGGGLWVRPRREDQTELEYQLRNWYYFNWIGGDHIVEQHIHNLDVGNWLMKDHPVECNGMGGRQVRTGGEHGEIFDHHCCEFAYANGVRMFSQCRHIRGCWNAVAEHAHGTKGSADISGAKIYSAGGALVWSGKGGGGGHQEEHCDLFAALRQGEIYNEAEAGAQSTMTAIMGRLATYSGQVVKWDEALNSNVALADFDNLRTLQDEAPVKPHPNGGYVTEELYEIAVPGATRVI